MKFSARLIGIVLLASHFAIGWSRPVPNGFLNKAVRNAQELIAQVRADAEVRSRYTRHYAMTPQELYEFFKTFRVARLAQDESFRVYGVPESGELKAKSRVIKKGTAVFVVPDGRPVMLVACGNPLDRGPKDPIARTSTTVADRVAASLVPMPVETATVSEEVLLASMMQPALPEIVSVPPPVIPPTSPVVVTTGGEGPGTVLPVAGLGVLPALFLVGGGGGSSPVPEPGTLLALSAGIAGLALRRRVARRR